MAFQPDKAPSQENIPTEEQVEQAETAPVENEVSLNELKKGTERLQVLEDQAEHKIEPEDSQALQAMKIARALEENKERNRLVRQVAGKYENPEPKTKEQIDKELEAVRQQEKQAKDREIQEFKNEQNKRKQLESEFGIISQIKEATTDFFRGLFKRKK
jgi:hypothetical protein